MSIGLRAALSLTQRGAPTHTHTHVLTLTWSSTHLYAQFAVDFIIIIKTHKFVCGCVRVYGSVPVCMCVCVCNK